jgi:catechol 2,3-dioxygenase-like lactoylglutathione lyase family enzyme
MPAFRISGLDHVQLAIPRGTEDEARRFYGGLLGLTEVDKPAPLAARGGCWFAGRNTVLHLGVEEPFAPAHKAHPAFLVSDLDACREALLAAGAPVVPEENAVAVRRFYTADPFGNRIELIQDGDGFSQQGAGLRTRVRLGGHRR